MTDFSGHTAYEILREVRRILKTPEAHAVTTHAEDIMAELHELRKRARFWATFWKVWAIILFILSVIEIVLSLSRK